MKNQINHPSPPNSEACVEDTTATHGRKTAINKNKKKKQIDQHFKFQHIITDPVRYLTKRAGPGIPKK